MSDTTQHFYRGLKTFTGTGRVSKTAYWAFAELYLFLVVVVGLLALVFIPIPALFLFKAFVVLFLGLWWLIITMMPMTIRRLHDVGYSGTHYLRAWSLIGIVGLVEILLQESQPTPNEYGPVPNSPSGHSRWSREETRQHRSQYQERQAPPIERANPVGLFFRGLFTFSGTGRATRMEYWCYALPYLVIVFIIWYLLIPGDEGGTILISMVCYIWLVVTMAPMTVRRLHDTGHSGWMYLHFVWAIGWVVLLVVLSRRSQPFSNEYG